jgi:DNA-binding CsgD family transcriptional regulator
MWQFENGEIPDGMCVLHTCDNRLCVNPNHLFIGTHLDNAKDRDQKGRAGYAGSGAPRPWRLKFSEEEVEGIRKLLNQNQTQRSIAKQFDCSQRTITKIKQRIHYK